MNIAILGAGQLGRMLALAAYPLGMTCMVIDPQSDPCGGQVARHAQIGFDDPVALEAACAGQELITYEFENIPVSSVEYLARSKPVWPPPGALRISQDRWLEKSFFRELNVATAGFQCVDSPEDIRAALKQLGLPAVLKTRRLGYDGKGQVLLQSSAEADAAWQAIGRQSAIVEAHVTFDRELSILAVRRHDGAFACYPLIENHHREGILRLSIAPAPLANARLQEQAEAIARQTAEALGYVGLLAIELFELNGALMVNEMAPRVHNSGHWSIEGALTSQFENHLRAIAGLPLGATAAVGQSAMINIIGTLPQQESILQLAGAHLHLYGKSPRPGRKLGHWAITRPDLHSLAQAINPFLDDSLRSVLAGA